MARFASSLVKTLGFLVVATMGVVYVGTLSGLIAEREGSSSGARSFSVASVDGLGAGMSSGLMFFDPGDETLIQVARDAAADTLVVRFVSRRQPGSFAPSQVSLAPGHTLYDADYEPVNRKLLLATVDPGSAIAVVECTLDPLPAAPITDSATACVFRAPASTGLFGNATTVAPGAPLALAVVGIPQPLASAGYALAAVYNESSFSFGTCPYAFTSCFGIQSATVAYVASESLSATPIASASPFASIIVQLGIVSKTPLRVLSIQCRSDGAAGCSSPFAITTLDAPTPIAAFYTPNPVTGVIHGGIVSSVWIECVVGVPGCTVEPSNLLQAPPPRSLGFFRSIAVAGTSRIDAPSQAESRASLTAVHWGDGSLRFYSHSSQDSSLRLLGGAMDFPALSSASPRVSLVYQESSQTLYLGATLDQDSSFGVWALDYAALLPSVSLQVVSADYRGLRVRPTYNLAGWAGVFAKFIVYHGGVPDPLVSTPIETPFSATPAHGTSPEVHLVASPASYTPGDVLTVVVYVGSAMGIAPFNTSLTVTTPQVPHAIASLTVSAVSATSLALDWPTPTAPASDPVTSYVVQYVSAVSQSNDVSSAASFSPTPEARDSDGVPIVVIAPDAVRPVSLTVAPSTVYEFSVYAVNSAGRGFPSSGGATLSVNTPCTSNVPDSPRISGISSQTAPLSVKLAWVEPPDGGCPLSHYTIEVISPNAAQFPAWTRVADAVPTTRSVFVIGADVDPSGSFPTPTLLPSTAYQARVSAVNTNGASVPAESAEAITGPVPFPPSAFTATASNPREVSLTWGSPPPPPIGDPLDPSTLTYTLRVGSDADVAAAADPLATVTPGASGSLLAYTASDLVSQTTYVFAITASNVVGTSGFATVSATTPPGCFPTCVAGQGTCSVAAPFQCNCNPLFAGPSCNIACTCVNGVCNDGSAGDGLCVAGSCTAGWEGSLCDVPRVPAVSACTSSCTLPASALAAPSAAVSLSGSGLDAHIVASVNGTAVPTTYTPPTTARDIVLDPTITAAGSVSFVPPPLSLGSQSGGYVNVTLTHSLSGARTSILSALYMTGSECTAEGEIDVGGSCGPCPTGAFCPGGARIWPRPGYWLPTETSGAEALVECTLADACPGALGTNPSYRAQTNDDGSRVTAVCATQDGYTGRECTDCLDGFYKDSGKCYSCGLSDADKAEFYLLGLVVIVFIGFIAGGVAFLPDKWLDRSVTLLLGIQQLVFVGRLSSTVISGPTGVAIANTFRSLSFVLFDIEVVKPTCTIGKITYAQLFFGTLMVIGGAATLFTLAAALFATLQARKHPSLDRSKMMWIRALHSYLLLGTIVYLHINVRLVEALYCADDGTGIARLNVEPGTVCWEGTHIALAFSAAALALVYSLGFPLTLFTMVTRAHRRGLTERDRHVFGYLIRGVREDVFWMRFLGFVVNLSLALQTTLFTTPSVKLFTALLSFLINMLVVGIVWPFKDWWSNYLPMFIGIATTVQIVLLRTELSYSLQLAAFIILAVVYVVVGVARGRVVYIKAKENPRKARTYFLFACCWCLCSCIWIPYCRRRSSSEKDSGSDDDKLGHDDDISSSEAALEAVVGADTRTEAEANFFDKAFVPLPVVPTKILVETKKKIRKKRRARRAQPSPPPSSSSSSAIESSSSPYSSSYLESSTSEVQILTEMASDLSSMVDTLGVATTEHLETARARIDALRSRLRSVADDDSYGGYGGYGGYDGYGNYGGGYDNEDYDDDW